MRTTVDINDAVLRELRKLAAKQGRPFRAVLEETLQRGLASRQGTRQAVTISPLPIGIRRAVSGMSLNQVYDQFEADAHGNAQ
jgi:hypothetical protein